MPQSKTIAELFNVVLYKRTSTGKIQTWYQEIDGNKYRTISGQKDGKKVTSEWTVCEGKNIGKANETSPELQCELEVQSNYTKKLAQGKYHTSIKEVDNSTFFAPMLAKDWHDYKPTQGWSQPKLDGVRCILKADGLWSRNGKPIISAPHISTAFNYYFKEYPKEIFDGELYADRLSDDFQKIVSLARQQKPTEEDLAESAKYLKLHIYDYPSCLANFEKRMLELNHTWRDIFNDKHRSVTQLVRTDYVKNQLIMDELYASYMEEGYEGQMIRLDGPYKNGRSDQLLKRKEFKDKEFKVLDIIEGEGNWSGMAKAVQIELDNGDTQNTGMRGTREFAKFLLHNKKSFKYATIRYQRLSNDGRLIFPVAVSFYTGKRDI